jgi:pyridine nucleotide-disulfide oxidoreductase family protein
MKRLLLAGGGHAHAFVLRALAQQRPRGLEVTLVTPYERQLYSGMLPGWIAGIYGLDELAIPLKPLVQAAGVRIALDRIVGLDPVGGSALTARGGRFEFDAVSLATGSEIAVAGLAGTQHALPLRPIEDFVARWAALAPRLAEAARPRITVIGAGAGGVEVALAIAAWMRAAGSSAQVQLVSGGALLPGHGDAVQRRARAALMRAQVRLVDAVARSIDADHVDLDGGAALPSDVTLLASGAAPPAWLAATPLARDAAGFVRVDRTLRSVSHDRVWAAGDLASMVDTPRPRSGVYAVRAGPPLAANLLAWAEGAPPRAWRPQRSALYLLATGGRHAIASWRGLAWEGDWVWRWKDRIDRAFMARFRVPH